MTDYSRFSISCETDTKNEHGANFYVFPYTDIMKWDEDHVSDRSRTVHICFFCLYLVLLFMTFWSFLSASCTDPGYVPRNITTYDKTKLLKRELLLWNYI